MRHVLSLIAGLFAAPIAWLAATIGLTALLAPTGGYPAEVDTWADTTVIAYAGLAVAGLVLGPLATLRVSPAGPLLAGLLLIGGGVIADLKAEWLDIAAVTDALKLPEQSLLLPAAGGVPVIAGALLVFSVFSFSRWRKPVTADASAHTPAEAPLGQAALDDTFGEQPINPFAPSAPTYEPMPSGPSQPSAYVDDGEAATTQLPQPPYGQQPGQQNPPVFPSR